MTKTDVQRLDKLLSHAGLTPRSAVKRFLKEHEVHINDKRIRESGFRVSPEDIVTIDGKKLDQTKSQDVYFALNKPMGIISTTSDSLGRENVTDLIDTEKRIYPIGRLDKDTHGLILLTNNGELTHKLIHPKYHVAKVYRLAVAQTPTNEQLEAFKNGIILKEGVTLPAEIRKIDNSSQNDDTHVVLEVVLHEGRYRQIRRMCEHLGIELLDLQRIAVGPVQLGDLKIGEYRPLSENEIDALTKSVKKE